MDMTKGCLQVLLLNTVSPQVPFGRATFTLVADWHAHYPLWPDLTPAPSADFRLKGNSWGKVWEPLVTKRLGGPPHRCLLDMGLHEGGEFRHTGEATWALASSRLACFSSVTAPVLQACCSSYLISTETYFGLLRIRDRGQISLTCATVPITSLTTAMSSCSNQMFTESTCWFLTWTS